MKDENEPGAEESTSDYTVGFCKPPTQTRFQPGRSGNPRGRPKGAKNLKTDLQEELREKILVREGDQHRQVSKQRAMVKALMARTLKGDARAANLMMSMMWRLVDTGEDAPEVEEPLLEHELEILRAYEERSRRDGPEEAIEEPESDDDTSEVES